MNTLENLSTEEYEHRISKARYIDNARDILDGDGEEDPRIEGFYGPMRLIISEGRHYFAIQKEELDELPYTEFPLIRNVMCHYMGFNPDKTVVVQSVGDSNYYSPEGSMFNLKVHKGLEDIRRKFGVETLREYGGTGRVKYDSINQHLIFDINGMESYILTIY